MSVKKYRKKPVEVEAIQNEGEWPPILAWLDTLSGGRFSVPFGHRPPITRSSDGTINIETLEGVMRADVGDFIIKGVQGEFYPCRGDIFKMTYEAVEDEE